MDYLLLGLILEFTPAWFTLPEERLCQYHYDTARRLFLEVEKAHRDFGGFPLQQQREQAERAMLRWWAAWFVKTPWTPAHVRWYWMRDL